jgi:ABC-type molybdenum transport system ATPase subunit/photorepair protein PhrA
MNIHFRKYANPVGPITLMGTLDLEEFYTPKFRSEYRKKYGQDTRKKGTLTELMELIGYSDPEIRKRFFSKIVSDRARVHSALYDVFMTYLLVEYAIKNYGMEI